MREKYNYKHLEVLANRIRNIIVDTSLTIEKCHPASSLSIVEIILALYETNLLKIGKNRNRNNISFILSKSHGILTYYSLLHCLDIISKEELLTFKSNEGLPSEPIPNNLKLFDYRVGPLGSGLALGLGIHISAHIKKIRNSKTTVLMSDGECQKGQTFEAAMYAGVMKFPGLIAVIDNNQLQMDGYINEVQEITLKEFWSNLGWEVFDVDGHNIKELINVIEKAKISKGCSLIVARTQKGNGIKEIENKPQYHYYRGEQEFKNILSKYSVINLPSNTKKSTIKKPRQEVVKILKKISLNDQSTVFLSADLLAGTGLDSLKGDVRLLQTTKRGRMIRLPLAENLLFRLSEGLMLKKLFPVIGIFESLVSIAMLELQSLALISSYFKIGMLILMTKPGRSSDDGFSMRSVSILKMLDSIPNIYIYDPRDLRDINNILMNIFRKKRGLNFLRIPDSLQKNSVYTSRKNNIFLYGNEKKSKLVILTSGWIYNVVISYLKEHAISNYLVLGVLNKDQIKKLPKDYIFNIFNHKNILVISDSHPDYLYNTLSEVLLKNKIVINSLEVKVKINPNLSSSIFDSNDVFEIIRKFTIDNEQKK